MTSVGGYSLENHEDFKRLFEIDRLSDKYEHYTPLKDTKVGFSVQRKYPNSIRYRPPVTKEGSPDVFALIHVFCLHPHESANTIFPERIPVVLKITSHSRYLNNRWDYDYADPECPTKESFELSRQSPKPVPLEELDEYFYDSNQGILINRNNISI